MNHLSAESGDAVSQLDGHAGDPSALLDPSNCSLTSESFFSSSNPNPERKIAFSATSTTSGSAFLSGGPSQSSLDVGAPRVTDGIAAGLNEPPTWDPAPENDKSLVNNRLYADMPSSQNRPQSQRPHVPPQHHASIGGAIPTIPTEVLDFPQWDVSMAKTSPGVEHPFRSLEEVFGTVAHLGGTAGVSYDPFVPQSTDFPLWSAISVESEFIPIPSGDHDCGVPPQGFVDCHSLDVLFLGGDLGSSAAGYKVSPSVELHYPPSPSPNPAPSNPRKRRASTLCHEIKASSTPAPCPTPRPSKQKPQPKNTVASLEIIQYQPTDGILSKKRPAFDEIITGSSTPQTLRRISFEDGSGHIKATMTTFGKRVKTRTPFSNEKRQRTAMARKEGVCARCKRSKRQCDLAIQGLYDSCGLCKGSKLYKGALRMPCFRSTLVDILFFRAGPAANEPLFTRRNTVFSLEDLSAPDVPVRTLKLTQNIGSHQLTVYASQFDPHPEDVLTYKWRDSQGKPHIVEMPAFCLTNMEKVQAHFLQYIYLAKWSYLESLRKEDDFSWMTVSMSMDYARRNPDSLVANALDLWAVSRMIEIPWEMCGHDTLGVSRIEEPENPHHGKIPIPPIMDTQLDQIVIQNILTPLRTKIIRKFEALISPAKPEAWFDIYLAAFIMLNHIEKLAKHSVFHARLHGMRTKYSNATFLEGAFHTAKVILSRFHFVCNGSAPLRLDWRDGKTIEMARLEPNEVEFMKKTQVIVRERENDVISLRETRKYEQTLYWCHQLYFEDWDKSPVHVIDE